MKKGNSFPGLMFPSAGDRKGAVLFPEHLLCSNGCWGVEDSLFCALMSREPSQLLRTEGPPREGEDLAVLSKQYASQIE